jgi:2-polyprenyl-6-hydroxyphenyl methylase / 3-demethylubiquinone-9 3-methyltransferase
MKRAAKTSTLNREEVDQFSRLADQWWEETGPMQPLHAMNPVRLQYIQRYIGQHFLGSPKKSVLDIGCGGGILSECLARQGLLVSGIDASSQAIDVAKKHATLMDLTIDYRVATAEAALATGNTYDIVTALEIIEHVDRPDLFVAAAAGLVKPNGLLFLSTLNRTPQSYWLGKVAAEYILRLVPEGTHDWQKFIKPAELLPWLHAEGFDVLDMTGVAYNPLSATFRLTPNDLRVNYMMVAARV